MKPAIEAAVKLGLNEVCWHKGKSQMDAPEPHKTDHDPALLIEERRGAACVLTLNRPLARNSLSLHLIAALNDAMAAPPRCEKPPPSSSRVLHPLFARAMI